MSEGCASMFFTCVLIRARWVSHRTCAQGAAGPAERAHRRFDVRQEEYQQKTSDSTHTRSATLALVQV